DIGHDVQEFVELTKRYVASAARTESIGRAALHPPHRCSPILGLFRGFLHRSHVAKLAAGFGSAHMRSKRAVAQHRTADIGRTATDEIGGGFTIAADREDSTDLAFLLVGESGLNEVAYHFE